METDKLTYGTEGPRTEAYMLKICYMTAVTTDPWGKEETDNKWCQDRYPYVRKIKLNLFYRTPHTKKINPRWFKDKCERKMKKKKKKSGRQYRGTFL